MGVLTSPGTEMWKWLYKIGISSKMRCQVLSVVDWEENVLVLLLLTLSLDQTIGKWESLVTCVPELIKRMKEDYAFWFTRFYCWPSTSSNPPMDRTTLCEFQSLRTKLVGFYKLLASSSMHAWLETEQQKGELLTALSTHTAPLRDRGASITSPSLSCALLSSHGSLCHVLLFFNCSQPQSCQPC